MKIVFFKNLTDAQKNKIEKFGIWAFFISSAVSTFIFLVLSIPAFLSSSQGAGFYLGFIFIPTSAFCLRLIQAGGFGGGVTQHITIQATINNDLDIRDLATKLAELTKDELAMSTGSQRF